MQDKNHHKSYLINHLDHRSIALNRGKADKNIQNQHHF